MCGIAGCFGAKQSELTQQMLDVMVYRGPDDGFLVSGETFTLGSRRLSIMDVDGGRQPLSNESGTIWATQNGELYNFPQVRPRLIQQGHVLRTHSDTEILPHLYEQYGTSFVDHLDGMYAVALWDDTEQMGILVRDRMGQKPLYYHQASDGVLYFASEMKCLLQIPNFQRQINLEALHHYLSLKHVPHPMTIFEGIYCLPPGHLLMYRCGEPLDIKPYWQLDFTPDDSIAQADETEIVDELLRLLRQGVKRRLMSDVPIGFFLSGGIDSSLSTVLASEEADSQIKTFTLTYGHESSTQGKELDKKWARWVADHYQTDHHEEVVEFTYFPDSIDTILSHFDEPFAGVISTYYLSRLISQHVKVALAGDAADELFGSYRSHRLAFPLSYLKIWLQSGLPDLLSNKDDSVYLRRMYEPNAWDWRSKLFVLQETEKQSLYHADIRPQMANYSTTLWLQTIFQQGTATDPLNQMLEAEYKTVFPDQVLTFVDRLSMAHSLEVRSAFLDKDFVEYVATLPGRLKIKNGETKYILKQVARRYFPEEMVSRPKEGFLMPITQWILQDLESYVRDILSPSQLAQHGLFDNLSVQKLVDKLYQDESDYTDVNKVYALVIFQVWYQQMMT